MKIGILSDTHGDYEAFLLALKRLGHCDYYLHCGDVLYSGFSFFTENDQQKLVEKIKSLDNFYVVAGNCDSSSDFKKIGHSLVNELAISIKNYNFYLHHGHWQSQKSAILRARSAGAKIIVQGHSHCKRLERYEDVILLNPGSPSRPRDGIASIAKLEAGQIRLISLADGLTISSLTVLE